MNININLKFKIIKSFSCNNENEEFNEEDYSFLDSV